MTRGSAHPILAVTGAELKIFWTGASAGVALAVFLGLIGFFFYNSVTAYVADSLGAAAQGLALDASIALFSQGLTNIPLVLMLVTPLVTMRAFSPFRRGGALDFFLTLPMGDWAFIMGQFLAAWISLGLLSLLALAPFIFLTVSGVGSPALLLTSALGLFALASAFAAVGLWASSLFPSPVAAGLATLGLLGLLWVLGWTAPYADPAAASLWTGLAFAPRLVRFVLGQIAWPDLLFFAILTILALINARLGLELRRHSGAD